MYIFSKYNTVCLCIYINIININSTNTSIKLLFWMRFNLLTALIYIHTHHSNFGVGKIFFLCSPRLQCLFEIVNVFTVTFNQYNAGMGIFQKILY